MPFKMIVKDYSVVGFPISYCSCGMAPLLSFHEWTPGIFSVPRATCSSTNFTHFLPHYLVGQPTGKLLLFKRIGLLICFR